MQEAKWQSTSLALVALAFQVCAVVAVIWAVGELWFGRSAWFHVGVAATLFLAALIVTLWSAAIEGTAYGSGPRFQLRLIGTSTVGVISIVFWRLLIFMLQENGTSIPQDWSWAFVLEQILSGLLLDVMEVLGWHITSVNYDKGDVVQAGLVLLMRLTGSAIVAAYIVGEVRASK